MPGAKVEKVGGGGAATVGRGLYPRRMRDSGVEWIGAIPEEWRVSSIKHHYEIILGKMLASEQQNDTDTLEKYFCAANVHFDGGADATNLKEMWFSVDEKRSYKVESGDLLVVEGGAGAGGAAVVQSLPFDAYVQNSILIVRGKNAAANAYAGYLLEVLVKSGYVDYVSNKATIPHFTKEKVGGVPLPLPPADELGKITEYLDTRCAEIDAAIASARQSIEEYKALKKSLVFETVTGKREVEKKGGGGGRPMRDSGVAWIGAVPEGWPLQRIVSLYREVSEHGDDSLPILSVSINTGVSNKELSDEEQERVFIRSADKSTYKRVQAGDLTYNMMRAWQGAFGAVRVNGMVSPAYVVARPKVEMDSRYVEYLLRTPNATREMQRYSRGIADFRLRLYWPEFKNIKIPCPPLVEQRAIADKLDEKCAAIDALIAEKEALIVDLEAYKKSLIFEVVTGKREVA